MMRSTVSILSVAITIGCVGWCVVFFWSFLIFVLVLVTELLFCDIGIHENRTGFRDCIYVIVVRPYNIHIHATLCWWNHKRANF